MVLDEGLDEDCMITFEYELSAAWLLLPWLRCAQASIGFYQHQVLSVDPYLGEVSWCDIIMARGPKVITDIADTYIWVSGERGMR